MSNSLPGFVTATVTLKNPSTYTFEKIQTILSTDSTFKIPSFDIAAKTVAILRPNETTQLNWVLALQKPDVLSGKIKVDIVSKPLKPQTVSRGIALKKIQQKTQHKISKPTILPGDYFYLQSNVVNTQPSSSLSLQIQYDPNAVELIRSSEEPLLRENDIFIVENESILEIKNIPLTQKKKEIPLSKLHFKALQPGEFSFVITENDSSISSLNYTITKE